MLGDLSPPHNTYLYEELILVSTYDIPHAYHLCRYVFTAYSLISSTEYATRTYFARKIPRCLMRRGPGHGVSSHPSPNPTSERLTNQRLDSWDGIPSCCVRLRKGPKFSRKVDDYEASGTLSARMYNAFSGSRCLVQLYGVLDRNFAKKRPKAMSECARPYY